MFNPLWDTKSEISVLESKFSNYSVFRAMSKTKRANFRANKT